MRNIFVICLISFTSLSCSKDPISGLERGWVWDALLGPNNGEIKFKDLDGYVVLYEGTGTGGKMVFDSTFSSSDIYTKNFPNGKYTVTYKGDSDDFKHQECSLITTSFGVIYAYENDGAEYWCD